MYFLRLIQIPMPSNTENRIIHYQYLSKRGKTYIMFFQRKVICFLQKLLEFPTCAPFFFSKKFCFSFFRIFKKKSRKNFFQWIQQLKISKIFSMNLVFKEFRIFFYKICSENLNTWKKPFCWSQGGIPTIFPGKSDMTFRWVLT